MFIYPEKKSRDPISCFWSVKVMLLNVYMSLCLAELLMISHAREYVISWLSGGQRSFACHRDINKPGRGNQYCLGRKQLICYFPLRSSRLLELPKRIFVQSFCYCVFQAAGKQTWEWLWRQLPCRKFWKVSCLIWRRGKVCVGIKSAVGSQSLISLLSFHRAPKRKWGGRRNTSSSYMFF